jgi:hypothetical protein
MSIITMMLSQSVLVAVSDFLMQFSPAGSLHTKIFQRTNKKEVKKKGGK